MAGEKGRHCRGRAGHGDRATRAITATTGTLMCYSMVQSSWLGTHRSVRHHHAGGGTLKQWFPTFQPMSWMSGGVGLWVISFIGQHVGPVHRCSPMHWPNPMSWVLPCNGSPWHTGLTPHVGSSHAPVQSIMTWLTWLHGQIWPMGWRLSTSNLKRTPC